MRNFAHIASLAFRFRNGWSLVRAARAGRPCSEVVLWDGTRLRHPPARAGLLETLTELWLKREYTDGFYVPRDGDVIVDAGANIGLFSILMARQNPKCRIVALEPYNENFRCLQTNVASARSTNITCCEIALGGTCGRGRMLSVGERSLDHILKADVAHGGSIPVVTLADLFDLTGSQEIDFLKVDIEGSEHETFRDVRPELLVRFKRIALEYHDPIAPGTMTMLEKVLAPSHDVVNLPSTVSGCGILRALRKPGIAPAC